MGPIGRAYGRDFGEILTKRRTDRPPFDLLVLLFRPIRGWAGRIVLWLGHNDPIPTCTDLSGLRNQNNLMRTKRRKRATRGPEEAKYATRRTLTMGGVIHRISTDMRVPPGVLNMTLWHPPAITRITAQRVPTSALWAPPGRPPWKQWAHPPTPRAKQCRPPARVLCTGDLTHPIGCTYTTGVFTPDGRTIATPRPPAPCPPAPCPPHHYATPDHVPRPPPVAIPPDPVPGGIITPRATT